MDINPKPKTWWDGAFLEHCQFDPRCECSALNSDRSSMAFRIPRPYDGHPKCDCPQNEPRPVMQWCISVAQWLCRECGARLTMNEYAAGLPPQRPAPVIDDATKRRWGV